MEYICSAPHRHLWSTRIPPQIFEAMDFSKRFIFDDQMDSGLRIAVSKTVGGIVPEHSVDPRVWRHVSNAVRSLNDAGFVVDTASPVFAERLRRRYFYIMANLWRCAMHNGYAPFINDGNKHLVDPVLLRIIQKGEGLSAQRIYQSLSDRDEVKKAVHRFFGEYDILITPTLPVLPPPAWTPQEESTAEAMKVTALMGQYTGIWNLTHNPAISINCGVERGNVPVGIQVVGRMYTDDVVMRFANRLKAICESSPMKSVSSKL